MDKKNILWKNQQEILEKLTKELRIVIDGHIPVKEKKKLKKLLNQLENTNRKLKKYFESEATI